MIVYGQVDSHGDVLMQGAFSKSPNKYILENHMTEQEKKEAADKAKKQLAAKKKALQNEQIINK